LRRIVAGQYDYWETGSRATLRELLVNEGVAVAAARAVAPGFEPWEYFGYTRRQYRRLRELDAYLRRVVTPELDTAGWGCGCVISRRHERSGAPGGRQSPPRARGLLFGVPDDRELPRGGGESRRPCGPPPPSLRQADDRALGIQTA